MKPVARRDFARGLALAGIALPFLKILGIDPFRPELARAGGGGAVSIPKRFIFWYTPDGISPAGQPDNSSGNGWPTDMAIGGSSPTDFTLGSFISPLAALKSQMVLMQGIDMHDPVVADTHEQGMVQVLTANGFSAACGTTKDCVGGGGQFGTLNQSLDFYLQSKMPSSTQLLNLAVQPVSGLTVSFNAQNSNAARTPIADPVVAYNWLFAEQAGNAAANAKLALQNKLRKSVLDNVRSEIGTLHSRLGTEDRQRLEAHLQNIVSVENSLQMSTGACSPPGAPAYPTNAGPSTFGTDDNYGWIIQNHCNVVAAAFACDLTRVATIQNRACYSPGNYCPFVGYNDDLHNMSHFSQGYAGFVKSRQYLYSQLYYLANLLKNTPEPSDPSQSLLDNTIILANSDIAEGHQHTNMPVFTIGGSNLGVNVGNFMAFGDNHQPYGDLFVSILNALGVADSTWATTGKAPLVSAPGGVSFLK